MAVWVVRAGSRGGQEQVAIDKNVATIHWNELPDLSGVTTRDALADLYRQRNTDASPNKAAIDVGQVWAFRERMKEGDLAVLPLHTRSAIAIGRIIGPYKYRTDLGSEVLHTRPVEWIRKDIPRTTFDQDILNSFGALMTVCQITRNNAEERIMAVLSGKEIPSQGMAATDQAGGGSDIAQSNNGYTSATIAFLKELPKRTSDTEWHKNNKIRYNHVLRDPTRNLIRQIREKYITRLSQDVADCPRQLSVLKKNDYGKGGYYGHYWFAFYDPSARTKTHSSQLFFILHGTGELCRYGFSLGYYSRQYLQRLRHAIHDNPAAAANYLSAAPSGTAVEIKINGNAHRWTVGDWANLLTADLAKATGGDIKDAEISIFRELPLDVLVEHDEPLVDTVGNYLVWAWPFFDASITGKWGDSHKAPPEPSLPVAVDAQKTPVDLTAATAVPHPTIPTRGSEPISTLVFKKRN